MSGSGSGGAGGTGAGGTAGGNDGGVDGPGGGGVDAPPDSTGFEPFVPDYFIGGCNNFGSAGPVPEAGSPLHGLTVVATGLTGMKALEVDGSNAYLAGASTISRLSLAGGASPEVMVTNAMPLATALDANNLYWVDASVAGQTTVLRVPLTATGWQAFAGDGGAGQTATMLAAEPGAPVAPGAYTLSAFTLSAGYLYFGAGNVVWRVSTGGGSAQMVVSGIAPTGIAVDGNNVYLGDDPNEAIQFVTLTGQFAGILQGFSISNATPTQLATNAGIVYWGDWFGSIEHAAIANPTNLGGARTPCGGAGCYPNRLRPGGAGVIWESGDYACSSLGTVDATGSKYFATSINVVRGIAVAGNHFYAVNAAGQLLRMDL